MTTRNIVTLPYASIHSDNLIYYNPREFKAGRFHASGAGRRRPCERHRGAGMCRDGAARPPVLKRRPVHARIVPVTKGNKIRRSDGAVRLVQQQLAYFVAHCFIVPEKEGSTHRDRGKAGSSGAAFRVASPGPSRDGPGPLPNSV